MFCAPGLIFGGTKGVGSRFLVLHSRTHFWRYLRRRVPFSCFALPKSFSAVPRASGLVFMFCARAPVFGGTEASGLVIMFCAPGPIFRGTDGVGFGFHILRFRASFRRYRRRWVHFSCFALLDSFSAVSRASGPVFGSTDGVGSHFHVLRSQTHFRRHRGHRVSYSCLRSRIHFRRYRRLRVPFLCFALPNLFSLVPSASGPVFMFCAPRLIFGGTESVGSRFYVLCSRTSFRSYRARRVLF
jgi:hypothetical protein